MAGSNLALGEGKLPLVLPSSVARVTANGLPTKHLVDWEQLTRNWYKVNVQALDTKLTEVKSTADNASAAVTTEIQARTDADGALALRIDSVEAYAGDATANGQIYFAAKAAPGGAAAAYGLYLTAGNAFAGFEVLADSAGGASIAFAANDFKLTDSGTAQNVFNYTGGVFTFNVPVQIGTVDILAGAVNAPAATTAGNTLSLGSTGGWTTIASVTATGASGYVALIHADFEYKNGGGWAGVFEGSYRIRRSDGLILYEGDLFNYANYFVVTHSRLDTSFNGTYTYTLDVNLTLTASSGTPSANFRRRGLMIDLRKR